MVYTRPNNGSNQVAEFFLGMGKALETSEEVASVSTKTKSDFLSPVEEGIPLLANPNKTARNEVVHGFLLQDLTPNLIEQK